MEDKHKNAQTFAVMIGQIKDDLSIWWNISNIIQCRWTLETMLNEKNSHNKLCIVQYEMSKNRQIYRDKSMNRKKIGSFLGLG